MQEGARTMTVPIERRRDTSQWFSSAECQLDDLIGLVDVATDLTAYPYASSVEQNVLVYDAVELRTSLDDPVAHRAIRAELVEVFANGPGIAVFANAFADTAPLDAATDVFQQMIADQHASGAVAGDHFATPGSNDRVWNALEKLALRAPDVFANYYANDIVALVSRAWLGPAYQITSQVNVVNPGGQAQAPHRDYHLGFQSDDVAEQYPAHVHQLSPTLTLQGAVAHCDMPVESGPTLYLPHSQKYGAGYVAWRRPDFIEYFAANHVQLPLAAGDAVFFNPALFHAAGTNRTSHIRRMANLLQVSSAFGRAMESVDREAMCNAVLPVLQQLASTGASASTIDNIVAATAEGYPFPTNLDSDQPIGGLAPASQADLLTQAVRETWGAELLRSTLRDAAARRGVGAG
jgi:ectoine hydroxylase-related dioxygenase (phytanoyl-CoA dioxygenase family)